MEFEVKQISPEKLKTIENEVQELLSRVLLEVNSKDYTEKEIEKLRDPSMLKYLYRKSITSFLAYQEEKLVGIASISDSSGAIFAMYVDPKFMRKGLGSSLLKKLENHIADNTNNGLIWVTSSITATNFFIKNRYKIIHYNVKTTGKIPINLLGKRIKLNSMSARIREISLKITYPIFTQLMNIEIMS